MRVDLRKAIEFIGRVAGGSSRPDWTLEVISCLLAGGCVVALQFALGPSEFKIPVVSLRMIRPMSCSVSSASLAKSAGPRPRRSAIRWTVRSSFEGCCLAIRAV